MMRLSARATALGVCVAAVCTATAVSLDFAASHADATMPQAARGPAPGRAARTRAVRTAPSAKLAAYHRQYHDGRFTGPVVDAYYGVVQVRAVIHGGRVVAVDVLRHPYQHATSRYINRRALPWLKQEVVQAQSARIDAISGATLTSEAFIRSTYGALRQARG